MKKRILGTILAVMFFAVAFAVPVSASVSVRKAQYKGNGRIEAEFSSRVEYKNVRIVVKDTDGVRIRAVILDRDRDDLDFRLYGFQQGRTYLFTISGIRRSGSGAFGSVNGRIRIPTSRGAVPVREVEYDGREHEVEFKFFPAVQWNRPKVTVTRGNTQYAVRITEKNHRELEVRVRKLTGGLTYRYRITGIRRAGAASFSTISGTFTA